MFVLVIVCSDQVLFVSKYFVYVDNLFQYFVCFSERRKSICLHTNSIFSAKQIVQKIVAVHLMLILCLHSLLRLFPKFFNYCNINYLIILNKLVRSVHPFSDFKFEYRDHVTRCWNQSGTTSFRREICYFYPVFVEC